MGFNQIKTTETLLKDETGCAWIVGYYARSDGEAITTLSGTTTRNFPVDIEVPSSIETWEYYKYTTQDFVGVPTKLNFITKVGVTSNLGNASIIYTVGTDNHTGNASYSATTLRQTGPAVTLSEFNLSFCSNSKIHVTTLGIFPFLKTSFTSLCLPHL